MSLFIAIFAAHRPQVSLNPEMGAVVYVTRVTAGACTGSVVSSPAAISVSWSASNFDPNIHAYRILENGILVSSQTTSTWQKTIDGNKESGRWQQWTSDWTYRVDVVIAATGVVLSSASAAPWIVLYGECRELEAPI